MIAFCETRTLAFWSRVGDASYGTYVFAFPIQQIALIAVPSFFGSMAIAMLATLCIAFLTWHLLEKKALLLIPYAAQATRSMFRSQGRSNQVTSMSIQTSSTEMPKAISTETTRFAAPS